MAEQFLPKYTEEVATPEAQAPSKPLPEEDEPDNRPEEGDEEEEDDLPEEDDEDDEQLPEVEEASTPSKESYVKVDRSQLPKYPEKPRPPTKEEAYEYYLAELVNADLKKQGINFEDEKERKEAINNAFKNDYDGMSRYMSFLKKEARKKADHFEQTEIQPWHQQVYDAKLAHETADVYEEFPIIQKYQDRITEIGPKFFEKFPQYVDKPLESLPRLLLLAILSKEKKGKRAEIVDPIPSAPMFERGGRSRKSKNQGDQVMNGRIIEKHNNPGDLIAGW